MVGGEERAERLQKRGGGGGGGGGGGVEILLVASCYTETGDKRRPDGPLGSYAQTLPLPLFELPAVGASVFKLNLLISTA